MILGNAVIIVLDWLFIVRLQMGTAGAAAATSIGFLCAAVYEVCCILRAAGSSEVYALAPQVMGEAKVPVGNIVKIGIPGALITVMLSISNIVLNNSIGSYGSDAVAAYAQALGRAKDSLMITMLRNIILFIPCVIVLNALVGLTGAIAAQPVVETILAAVCLAMYLKSCRWSNE